MAGFLEQYFIAPIYTSNPYNFVNTPVYAVVALVLLYVIYKGLQKLDIKIDRKFFYALLPFIVFGSMLRAFVDNKIITEMFWTVSPGIWMSVAGLFLLCFAISFAIGKYTNKTYWKICSFIGIFALISLIISNYSKIELTNLNFGLIIIGLAAGVSALLYFIFKGVKAKWYIAGCGFFPFMAHMLDASATFIAVDFLGASEKHPLTNMLNEFAGTAAVFFLLKLIIILPLVYLIQTQIKNKNLANYLLISIAVLGLAEGLRDLITISLI